METTQKKSLDYRWIIIGACFLMVFTALGFCSSTKKLFLVSVTEELGILRSVYSVSDSLRYITTAVCNMFFGILVLKFGPRKLIGLGFLSLIASMLCCAFATDVTLIYLGGILLGLGITLTTTTMVSYVVGIWYKEKRGTIMGVILCANGIGGALATNLLIHIINSNFRLAYQIIALILLGVGILVVAVFRDAPKDQELSQAKGEKKSKNNAWTGITMAEALKKTYFYTSAICVFLIGLCLQSVVSIDAAYLNDRGLDDHYIATVFSASSLLLTVAKFLVGACYDKKGLRFTMLICDVATLLMLGMLLLVNNSLPGRGMAMGYGIVSAFGLPLETIMIPLIAADLFGEKEYGKILGVFASIKATGYALGPVLTNIVFDCIGSYAPILLIYMGVMAAVTMAFLNCQKQAEKVKKETAMRESTAVSE